MLALLRVRQARENPAEFDERSPVDVAGACSLSQSLSQVVLTGTWTWQTNYAASPNDAGLAVDWQGALWAETRVP